MKGVHYFFLFLSEGPFHLVSIELLCYEYIVVAVKIFNCSLFHDVIWKAKGDTHRLTDGLHLVFVFVISVTSAIEASFPHFLNIRTAFSPEIIDIAPIVAHDLDLSKAMR